MLTDSRFESRLLIYDIVTGISFLVLTYAPHSQV